MHQLTGNILCTPDRQLHVVGVTDADQETMIWLRSNSGANWDITPWHSNGAGIVLLAGRNVQEAVICR